MTDVAEPVDLDARDAQAHASIVFFDGSKPVVDASICYAACATIVVAITLAISLLG